MLVLTNAQIEIGFLVRTDAIQIGNRDDPRRTSAKFSSAQTRSCQQHNRAVRNLSQAVESLGRTHRDASGVGRRVDPVLHAAPQVARQVAAYGEQHPSHAALFVAACVSEEIYQTPPSRFARLAEAQSGEGDPRSVEPRRVEQDFALLRQFAASAVLGSSSLARADSVSLRYRYPAGLDVVGRSLGYPKRLSHPPEDEAESGNYSQAACRHAGGTGTTSRTRERVDISLAVQASSDLAGVREDSQGGGLAGRPSQPIPQAEADLGHASCGGGRDRGGRAAPRARDAGTGIFDVHRSALHAVGQGGGRLAAAVIATISPGAVFRSSRDLTGSTYRRPSTASGFFLSQQSERRR